MAPNRPEREKSLGGLIRDALILALIGVALGMAYNASGLAARPAFGLQWIAKDRLAELPKLEASAPEANGGPAPGPFTTNISDPMAIGVAPQAAQNVPQVPDLDRPMQIELEAAKQFFDAGAAWFIDARDEMECDEAHIAGAICLPYDAVDDYAERLAPIEADGRPIITYCGGGLCEVSLGLAWELIERGHTKVLVYMGGFGLWEDSGYPVDRRDDGGSGER